MLPGYSDRREDWYNEASTREKPIGSGNSSTLNL